MRKKVLFIINPVSGIRSRQKKQLPSKIEKYLDHKKYQFEISYTEWQGHAKQLAAEAVEAGYDIVIAVGGDGSINEIASSLVGTDVVLGIVPFGSGNGLARDLGISINEEKALKVINKFHVKKIDVGEYGKDRYFFSNVGLGFAAYVVQRFESHLVRGFFSYAFAVIREFFHYRVTKVKLLINGEIYEREVVILDIFNANQFGYGVGLVPEAKLDDGKLNICVLNKFSRWRFPVYGLMVLLKKQHKIPHMEFYEASSLKVINQQNEEWLLQVDGECNVFDQDWNVKTHALALNILIP